MALCIVLLGISTPPALSLGDKMWESGNMQFTELANQRVDKPSGRIGVR